MKEYIFDEGLDEETGNCKLHAFFGQVGMELYPVIIPEILQLHIFPQGGGFFQKCIHAPVGAYGILQKGNEKGEHLAGMFLVSHFYHALNGKQGIV